MNKLFLSCLGLCLLGFTAQAQWVNKPIGFAADTYPFYTDAIDANTAWVVGSDFISSSYVPAQVALTVNGGQTWTVTTMPVSTADEEEFTALSAVNATTAWATTVISGVEARIIRTTNGGQTWTTQSSPTVYGNPDSYPDMIHFFSTTDGVTVGDPVAPSGPMEMFTTSNGGVNWTPVAAPPAAQANEYPLSTPPAAFGNHIWFATSRGRVFHSTDKGLTWTVATVAAGAVNIGTLVFRDAQNGLLSILNPTSTAHRLYRTTDGGATWAAVTYTGPLHGTGLSVVPGTSQYVSAGADIGNGDQGSSYSRDNGQTWVSLETTYNHFVTEFVSNTVGWSSALDFSGMQLNPGANRYSGTALATRTDAALQASLTVSPNPALGGRFSLRASRTAANPATVRVLDATGRLVQQLPWSNATGLELDLSREPAGLYLLEVEGATGVARQKVVVQ
ncbi:T9SS type A sorting domain-containing protein [Hymenobacter sp. DH14]|uniref:T9SS type A sorting domain-containing protein n=1 Tax=Hymenobacter cyanobacteriorum TaxID=2926463 RepID=A0A9X2AEV8_9BACT|nr:T9SS type A sorting domain-containing protein [Hymenobacter cyanobacteriorum]MCI1187207.1 T9SS type A sorting domain-containing protein [Hymenobacter cyanobacteriorum]